jgi:adenine-specific DNA-methyltransferase
MEKKKNTSKIQFLWEGKEQAILEHLTRPEQVYDIPSDIKGNEIHCVDNLDFLKLNRERLRGKVKCIYIDPPYNTGNNFIYKDKRHKGKECRHSKWLSFMLPRLKLARDLLREDGVIFVSIDDNEVHNLRQLMNEVFGEGNSLLKDTPTTLIWNKMHSQQQGVFKRYHEYILGYSKNISEIKNIVGGEGVIEAGALKKISQSNPASEFTFPAGVRFEAKDGTVITGEFGDSEKCTITKGRLIAENNKTQEEVTIIAGWTQKNQMISYFNGLETIDTKGQRVTEFYFNSTGKLKCLKDRSSITPSTILPEYGMVSTSTDYLVDLLGGNYFDTPKPYPMIKDIISWFTAPNDIILDFFAGSGTTGQAVMELNQEEIDKAEKDGLLSDGKPAGGRRFILVQLPEKISESKEAFKAGYRKISDITIERLRRAGAKYGGDVGFKVFQSDAKVETKKEQTQHDLF